MGKGWPRGVVWGGWEGGLRWRGYRDMCMHVADLLCVLCATETNTVLWSNYTPIKIYFKKWAKDLNQHFLQEDTKMSNRYMKRCTASLIIRKMQIQGTVNTLHLLGLPFVKKPENNKYWWVCGEIGNLIHCYGECKMIQPLWKTASKN